MLTLPQILTQLTTNTTNEDLSTLAATFTCQQMQAENPFPGETSVHLQSNDFDLFFLFVYSKVNEI